MFNDKHNQVYLVPVPIMVEYTGNTRYGDSDRGIGSQNKEEHMSDNFTKTELEALLRANKAEVDVVAATMKKDMAEWREQQNVQLANLNISIQSLSAKVDGKFEAVEGKIDGLKSSISTTQWTTSIGLALVTIIMSAVVLASSWIISSKGTTSLPQPTEIHSQQAEPSKK
ncbi:hypothetical protein [Xenorhabdus bovienii]|uniref:Uncharacterized protein n=1 Tax=Xenorhabdus bovienii str. feltiae Moldova TaxID=1398200 RepID=A0A077NI73_XENBV|nr:hypothetical protein [Xenorhabdus bovienii]CDH01837.1 hypothetical protein XBFM1_2330055 [Xenorhabdus bovienii str. feltiae Moldova]